MVMTPEERKAYALRQFTIYTKSPATLDAWKAKAKELGLSLNAFICGAVAQAVEDDYTYIAVKPEHAQAWKDRSQKAGLSLDAFVYECVTMAIEGTGVSGQPNTVNELKNQIHELQKQLEHANIEIERSRDAWRAAHSDSEKLAEIKKKILDHLQEGGSWSTKALDLKLKFSDIRLTSVALQDLSDMGLIAETSKGYKLKRGDQIG
jgi:predicted HicB family RNase H-like nuclease